MTTLQRYTLLGMEFTQERINRFLLRLIAGPNGCIICTYSLSKGYPQMSFNYHGVFTTIKCHRLAYALWVEEPDPALLICHDCDNTRCVNPNHLWEGSYQDNIDDCVQKNRWTQGGSERRFLHLLDRMKELISEGKSQAEIALLLGVSQATVSRYLL